MLPYAFQPPYITRAGEAHPIHLDDPEACEYRVAGAGTSTGPALTPVWTCGIPRLLHP